MVRATLALQVMPLGARDPLAAVDAAIGVIRASGVAFEVGPMETTPEGPSLDDLVAIARRAHRAALAAGAEAVQTNLRMLERPDGLQTMRAKTQPFRAEDPG